jgi:hypothetical protein
MTLLSFLSFLKGGRTCCPSSDMTLPARGFGVFEDSLGFWTGFKGWIFIFVGNNSIGPGLSSSIMNPES